MNHNWATAAVLDEIGSAFHYRTVELDDLRDDEVLVDIAGVGICHTDISAAEGAVPLRFPTVLGHEGAGTVRAVGNAVTGLKTGDRVVLGFDSCRTCATCTEGHPAYCRRFAALNYGGGRLDGSTTLRDRISGRDVHGNWFGQSSFATSAVASERNAVRIPDALPLHLAGPLGCGISTGAGTVLRVLKPAAGEGIVVFGLGAVGLGAIMAARVAGCTTVIGVDPDERRHALARDLGATHVVNSHDLDDRGTALREISPGGVAYSVDTVGRESVIRQALAALSSPGVCATLALAGGLNPVTIDQTHLLMGRTLTGVIEGDTDPQQFLPYLAELWERGQFPFPEMITLFPFEDMDAALRAVRAGDVVKAVLTPEGATP